MSPYLDPEYRTDLGRFVPVFPAKTHPYGELQGWEQFGDNSTKKSHVR
jgi:hypothetical protein